MRKKVFKFMTAILLFVMSIAFIFVDDKTIKVDAATNFEVVSDGSFDSLVAAIEKDNVDEIIVTSTIMCNNSSRDFFLDGKNKIIRAAITGVDESGMIQEGSEFDLINVIEKSNATIKNVTILGGSRLAICNRGYLYLENVNVMRSGNYKNTKAVSSYIYYGYGGIFNGDTGKLVMKNCNISRNVSKYGGAIYNYGGLVVLDSCSLTENRSNLRGGAIYSNQGKLVLNNTVIANNATVIVNGNSADTGGAIYSANSYAYIMNSTIVGNASSYYKKNTDPSTFGGGINIWNGKFYAVNNIITDNYAFNDGVPVESDIISNTNNIFLYNNIYKVITAAGVTEDSSNNYQLEKASSIEEIFVSYQTSGNILEDGSTNPIAFEKPILVSMPNGGVCVPTDKNCDLVENGVKTYINYTPEGKNSLFYLSYMKDGVNTKLGDALDISENEVTTFINGEERTNSIIGSTNSTGIKYRVIKGINSNSEAGTISGASAFGESYEYGSLVTVTAIPNDGYEFDYWMDETGNILSTQKEYTFEALKNITITPVWVSKTNVGNVTISNLTCDAVVYGNSRSIKLNNLNLEVGNKIEGLYLNGTKVADEILFLLPNISGITDENGKWIATEDVVLTANVIPTLGIVSTTGYSGTYDGSAHEIKVEAVSPEDIVYNWYFNGSLIEGTNTPTLSMTNVLQSGSYRCLLASIIDGEEVKIWSEEINVNITAVEVAIPTIVDKTYTYTGVEQEVELNGITSNMTLTGNKATNAGEYEVIISLDSNYVWVEEFGGKFEWSIEKANLDLSHIKFENVTVTYDGLEHKIEINGTLPKEVTVSYYSNIGVDVKTYNALVEFSSDNYKLNVKELTATLKIEKAQAEITVDTTDINVMYGDEIKLPEATTNFGEVTITKVEMINVGEYTVNYSVERTTNYDGDSKEVKVIISPKAVIEPTVKGTYTYNKAEQTVELNGVESYMTIVSGTKGTNADDYVVVLTLDNNYVWAEGLDGKVEWSIEKAQAEITVDTTDINVMYGDEIKLPEATTNFGEVIITKVEMINVGEYTVNYSVEGTTNYDGDSKEVKVIISPKAVIEPTVKGTYTYNKAEQTVELNGVESYMTIVSGTKGTNADDYVVVLTLDNNYVWAEGLDGKVEWSIAKAIYDMSGIKFENVTVTYDGAEHKALIVGTLPEGVTVTYENNVATNAGTYNAFVKFTGNANYNAIPDMNAVLKINKAKVELPEATTSFTYNGVAHTAVNAHNLYTVTNNSATNAGNYETIVTLKDAANYEWAQTFNGKIAWSIAKATYDMSGITFADITVTYDGAEHKALIAGTLPEGVTVTYENNVATNAGTYNAFVKFTGNENYNDITGMNAVLKINKAKVELPEATTSFTYNGVAHTAVNAHNLYTVTNNTATNAGNYETIVTLKDAANYEWAEEFNGKIAWSIAKATYDMSGIKFNDVTVVYNGNEHKTTITGILPTGVTVTYENNAGTNAGTYNAVAKFTGNANYNAIPDMNAVLTINIDSLDTTDQIKDENGKPMVEVSFKEGIAPGTKLDVNVEEEIKTDKSIREKLGLEKNEKVAATYDINLSVDGNNVEPNGNMTVKLLIPSELRGKQFSIKNIKNGIETEEVDFTIDGDYAIIKTDEALEFAIVYETGSLLWLIILLTVFVALEVGALVFLLNKKKAFNTMKLAAYPVFAFGMFLPVAHLVFAIILLVAFIGLTTVDAILAFVMYGDKIKSFFKKDKH